MSVLDRKEDTTAKTRATYARDRLKEKFPAILSFDEVADYIFNASERSDTALLNRFTKYVLYHPEIHFDKKKNLLSYRPPYAIRTPEQLIAFFQSNNNVECIEVSKLKKGWADCDAAIDQMENEHKLQVIRNKKDHNPRIIFADDPTLFAPLEKDFVDLYSSISLPGKDDIIRFLIAAKRTPAGQVANNKAVVKNAAKVRKSRQSTKQTNKHMTGLFRDYSQLRTKKGT